jgi:hypothetical protein
MDRFRPGRGASSDAACDRALERLAEQCASEGRRVSCRELSQRLRAMGYLLSHQRVALWLRRHRPDLIEHIRRETR